MMVMSLGLLSVQCTSRSAHETIRQEPPGSLARPCPWHVARVLTECVEVRNAPAGHSLIDVDGEIVSVAEILWGTGWSQEPVSVVKSQRLPRPKEYSSGVFSNPCGSTATITHEILESHPADDLESARQEVERRCRLDRAPAP